jgi:hypothetical protein
MRSASGSCVGIVLFQEFERYIGHAHMKLRVPMRQEHAAGKQAEALAPSSAPAAVAPAQRLAAPPPSRPTPRCLPR